MEKRERLFCKICGSVNLWDTMEKIKLLNWDDLCKKNQTEIKRRINTAEINK